MEFGKSVFKFLTCTSKTIGRNILSRYSSHLRSYTSACETDPNLQSFDSVLRERINKFLSSLRASGGETQSSSIDSHIKVYEFLFQLFQDTVRFITENREDVWKNKDLKSLVDAYFKSTETILDFCNTVQDCVKKAEKNQLLIQNAVKEFDTEENGDDVNEEKNKYAKTLEALNKCVEMEDPFNGDFSKKYKLVYEEQLLLLKELHKQKNKPEKKLKNLQTWKTMSNVVFMTALVSVLILTLAADEDESPGLALNITALHGPIVSTEKWCNDMCKEFEKALKRQQIDVESIEMGVAQMNVSMENMKVEAEGLKTKVEIILASVKLAVEKEDEVMVRVVMQKIKDNIDEFTLKVQQVGRAAGICSESIAPATLDVLEHITT